MQSLFILKWGFSCHCCLSVWILHDNGFRSIEDPTACGPHDAAKHSLIFCTQAMHVTELSSSHSGSRGRRSRSAGLGHDAYNTRSLPRHFKLSTHQQGAAQSYYEATKDVLYVSKSIALICQLPYVHAARKFLTGLHRWVLHLMTWKI